MNLPGGVKLVVTMSAEQANKSERVEPVFFLNNEVDQEEGKYLNTLEVCLAVCNVVSDENVVEGAQRIGGLPHGQASSSGVAVHWNQPQRGSDHFKG